MDELKSFKKEICQNCRNEKCEKGIVIVKNNNELFMKCCDYMPKDKPGNKEIDIIRYYEGRKAND